ncbi:MAG: amino acid ABC transporter substrate-binding protein [Desulfobacterales bacterium]|nr:amino acid ABC transporter substrate-binding protein [Desulfobacterales bacterium]
MKKKIIIFFIILFALPAFGKKIDVTIYVDDAYKPYSFEGKDGKAEGMYIDVLRTAFSRMNEFEVKMEPVPWKRGKKMMEEGNGFALTPAFYHGHDWPYLYPYSLPFYTETIITVCSEEKLEPPKPNWPDDYIGMTIGNVAGFDGWGGEKFKALVEKKKIPYEEVKGSSSNILKLGSKRIDCIMMEELAFEYEFKRLMQNGRYKKRFDKIRKGTTIGKDNVYIGYSKTAIEKGKYPFQFKFMQAFDSEIYRMIKSGEIKKIMNAYR